MTIFIWYISHIDVYHYLCLEFLFAGTWIKKFRIFLEGDSGCSGGAHALCPGPWAGLGEGLRSGARVVVLLLTAASEGKRHQRLSRLLLFSLLMLVLINNNDIQNVLSNIVYNKRWYGKDLANMLLNKISTLYTSYYICKVIVKETVNYFLLYLIFLVLVLPLPQKYSPSKNYHTMN